MPRTFLVERIVDLSSSVKDNDAKFKVADDVTSDEVPCQLMHDEKQRCVETQRTEEQKMMMLEQQRDVAMTTSVVDCSARSAVKPGKSHLQLTSCLSLA